MYFASILYCIGLIIKVSERRGRPRVTLALIFEVHFLDLFPLYIHNSRFPVFQG